VIAAQPGTLSLNELSHPLPMAERLTIGIVRSVDPAKGGLSGGVPKPRMAHLWTKGM
jgi:hypothetical protein